MRFRSMGIDPSTGRVNNLKNKWRGISTLGMQNDRVYCGVSEPKYWGNFSTMFRWRDVINLSFAYRSWSGTYNSTLASKVENADKRYNVDERYLLTAGKTGETRPLFKGLNNESSTYKPLCFVQG